jgi:hypothetical protein
MFTSDVSVTDTPAITRGDGRSTVDAMLSMISDADDLGNVVVSRTHFECDRK